MTRSHSALIAALVVVSLGLALQLGQEAVAQPASGATCEIMNWKGLQPRKSMEEFQGIVSTHSGQSSVQIMPITSAGNTTGFMVCSW